MSTYLTQCKSCERKFKTLYSLLKHYDTRHPESDKGETKHDFYDCDGCLVEHPKPEPIPKKYSEGYSLWVSGIAERINAALHPCLPGRLRCTLKP
jgi:hypothetical protein